jgi:hypothetical protein
MSGLGIALGVGQLVVAAARAAVPIAPSPRAAPRPSDPARPAPRTDAS